MRPSKESAQDQIMKLLAEQWSGRTLETLRLQAVQEKTGAAFDAIRALGGKRMLIVMCVVDPVQIARLRDAIDFVDNGPALDWAQTTLLELVARTALGGGMAFETLKDRDGNWSALAMIAAEPRSMTIIEAVFGLKS